MLLSDDDERLAVLRACWAGSGRWCWLFARDPAGAPALRQRRRRSNIGGVVAATLVWRVPAARFATDVMLESLGAA